MFEIEELVEKYDFGMTIYFDGSHCEQGGGARVVFVTPQRVPMSICFKLSFECINNNVEYKALILGLKLAIDMTYENLKIYGNSLLIINQVKEIYSYNHPRLNLYKAMVETLLEHFKAYNIEVTPRYSNYFVDTITYLGSLIP